MGTAITAPVGHLLTHAGDPPHKSHTRGMPEDSIRMAPNGHAFAQAPQDIHVSRSSTSPPVSGLLVSAPTGHARTQGAVPHWWQTVGVSVHVSSSEWILIRDRSGEYVPPWAALQASSHALHLVHFDGSVTRRTRGVASSAAAWEGPFSAPSPMRSTR